MSILTFCLFLQYSPFSHSHLLLILVFSISSPSARSYSPLLLGLTFHWLSSVALFADSIFWLFTFCWFSPCAHFCSLLNFSIFTLCSFSPVDDSPLLQGLFLGWFLPVADSYLLHLILSSLWFWFRDLLAGLTRLRFEEYRIPQPPDKDQYMVCPFDILLIFPIACNVCAFILHFHRTLL